MKLMGIYMTKLEKLENQLEELQEEYKSINPYFKNLNCQIKCNVFE